MRYYALLIWPRVQSERKMAVGSGAQRRALLGDEDASLVFETSKEIAVIPTFDAMGLHEDLLRGIYAYG